MPEGVDATSFEFYEGIRIFVPGALAVAVADSVTRTVSSDGSGLGLGAFQAIVAALIAGLAFYFVDAPSKAAVMSPLQPTSHLRAWGLKPKQDTTLLNNYFVMLDVLIPAGIKARALYMGSMFRIGFELIYLFGVSGIVMLSTASWSTAPVKANIANIAAPAWLLLASVVTTYLIALKRDVRADRIRRARPSATDMEAEMFHKRDALVCLMSLLATGLVLGFGNIIDLPTWLLGLPVAIVTGLWMYRYFKGYPVDSTSSPRKSLGERFQEFLTSFGVAQNWSRPHRIPTRRPSGAAQATLLLGVGALCAIGSMMARPLGNYLLSEHELRGWSIALALTLILIAARGHEKRLKGAYATQNTWLTLNRSKISSEYFDGPTS